MRLATGWRDALLVLDDNGWDSDDIESACEALFEACDESADDETSILGLTADDVARILEIEIDEDEANALTVVAHVLGQSTAAANAVRRALFDLDAFAWGSDEEE